MQQAARTQIDELRNQSSGAARMRVLTALLRLGQACCDLRLLGQQGSSSAKLSALLELVEEAIDGGHRVLIFGQFTAMLDIISGTLEEAEIRFAGWTAPHETGRKSSTAFKRMNAYRSFSSA